MFARLGDLGSVRPGRPDARGARLRGGDRAEGRRSLILVTTLAEPRGRSRRAAARVAPAVVSLGADGVARDAHDAAAGGRRAASRRGAAHAPERRAAAARAARVALLGAVVGGSLDRAMDVAATLEVRGFAVAPAPAPRRAARASRVSRHDLALRRARAAAVARAGARRAARRRAASFQRLSAGAHARSSAGTLVLCARADRAPSLLPLLRPPGDRAVSAAPVASSTSPTATRARQRRR